VNAKLTKLWATKNKNDEWWSSFVTSPLAIAANYFVADVKWVTPNLLTFFSFLAAIAACCFIVLGGMVNFLVAAGFIHLSHVLDCMDGQLARYRKTASPIGSFFDKLTDQIQVTLWFGSAGYAAYSQTQSLLPVFLAFTGVAFYSLRGYIKYVAIYAEMEKDSGYLEAKAKEELGMNRKEIAGLGFDVSANLRWFLGEQKKLVSFNEGVFIFMLSFALIFDKLLPMLWVFALSQVCHALYRGWSRGCNIGQSQGVSIVK
jgi:phosphatidylglycerophosphate synthase